MAQIHHADTDDHEEASTKEQERVGTVEIERTDLWLRNRELPGGKDRELQSEDVAFIAFGKHHSRNEDAKGHGGQGQIESAQSEGRQCNHRAD
ncbi:unannotated protein [freshwater metagenome]|uniref:Unannotated protein n=1 Tax=freshwater metagenome TaxID=449393 RepID=A0A6J6CQS1_9ZZZZ